MMLYIDPGTGSMLFTILIGVIGAGVYAARNAMLRIRFLLSGGRQDASEQKRLSYVIFSDSKRYWNVFEPICDEFEKRGEEICYWTASPDDPALSKQYEHVTCEFIGEGNKAFARMNMVDADIVLSSTPGLDVYQWKRSRDAKWYVHVFHAVTDITMYRMFGIDYYDALLLPAEFHADQVRELERKRHLPEKEMQVVGLPSMDTLYERAKNAVLPQHERTTVLLAPSWGASAIFSLYGGSIIDALLDTGYQIIVRPHPQSMESEKELMDKLINDYPNSDQLKWDFENDNFTALAQSDILISDFSGVIFDYAMAFDKPVIYTEPSYNKDPYDACWIDEELWTLEALHYLGACFSPEDVSSLKETIDRCLTDTQYEEGREKVRREGWYHPGESARLIADYLIAKRHELVSLEE